MNEALAAVARKTPELGRLLAADWDTPIAEHSRALWAPVEGATLEPALRAALIDELTPRLGAGAAELVAAVERVGVVVTPHHVCPTNGPTFGAIDRLVVAGAPGPVLVLAWSGVPMSNTAASGALCFSRAPYEALLQPGPESKVQRQAAKDRERDGITERRVVLVPPDLRDALVYECALPARVGAVLDAATPALRRWLPDPTPGETYPAWSLRVCEGIERALLHTEQLWYVDLNRVAARYLSSVAARPDHPLARLLDAPPPVDEMSWFYARRPGKRESVETRTGAEVDWVGRVRSGALCPGLVPVFGALRLLSRVRLLGGFRQVQYLERIASVWVAAGVEDRGVPGRLATGRLDAHPLDYALGAADRSTLPPDDAPMSTLWTPILARLVGR